MKKFMLVYIVVTLLGLSSCSSNSASDTAYYQPTQSEPLSPPPTIAATSPTPLASHPASIWDKLQHFSSAKLHKMQNETSDPDQTAWVELALLAKQKLSTAELVNKLTAWRQRHPNHAGNQLFPANSTLTEMQTMTTPKQIAVLLPQTGSHAALGQKVREGFLNSYYAKLAQSDKQNVRFYDTARANDISLLYQQAMTEGADFIVGPLLKENVQQIKATPVTVPTLALNYTDTNLALLPAHFYEYGLLPEDEAHQIADRASSDGYHHALLIAPDNEWGKRLAATLVKHWESLGGDIQASWFFSQRNNFDNGIAHLLKIDPNAAQQSKNKEQAVLSLRRQDFDVIFLIAQPTDSHAIVPLLHFYYVNKTPIYSTSAIYTGKLDPVKDMDLDGVVVCDIPHSQQASADRLYAVGQDAYLLSASLQRLKQLPNFPLYAATGALTLSADNQIHRRLPCHAIHHGRV